MVLRGRGYLHISTVLVDAARYKRHFKVVSARIL